MLLLGVKTQFHPTTIVVIRLFMEKQRDLSQQHLGSLKKSSFHQAQILKK